MAGVKGLPDLVFTANAAVVKGDTAYLAHFKHQERQPERAHYKVIPRILLALQTSDNLPEQAKSNLSQRR